jgi:hypothetical protein
MPPVARPGAPVVPGATGQPPAPAASGPDAVVGRLKLDALVFAPEAADRMAFIDGQKYVEGQRLEGLTVESITQEGVVLTDGSRRFVLRPRLNPYAPPVR